MNDLDVIKDKLSQRLTVNNPKSSFCINKTSTDLQKHSKMSDEHQESDKDVELENSMAFLATTTVNDGRLDKKKIVSIIHDRTLQDVKVHQKPPVDQVVTNDSTVGDCIESIDSDLDNSDQYGKLNIRDPSSNVHDVNFEEPSSDVKCSANDYVSNGRTSVDSTSCDHDNEDDNGNDDYIGDSVIDPAKFINDIISEHISDNLPIVSHNEDVDDKENHTDIPVSDKAFEDEGFGPTDAVPESGRETSAFECSHDYSDVDHSVETNDESLDSFFDCVTLKQRSEHRVKSPDLNDVVEPSSVVSRKNLSKVRNIMEKKLSEYEHGLHEQQITTDQKLDNHHSETIPSVKNCTVSNVDAKQPIKIDQKQPPKSTFQERNEYRASYPFFHEYPSI